MIVIVYRKELYGYTKDTSNRTQSHEIYLEQNDIVTSKEVAKAMELEYSWKMTTTLTILSRLVIKHFLASERIGRMTHYTILIAKKIIKYLKQKISK